MARARRLLGMLNEMEYRTARELADALGRSDKTVRTALHDLGELLEQHGARLDSRSRHGYRLEVTDRAQFEAFQTSGSAAPAVPDGERERVDSLILCLVYLMDYVKLQDLCDVFYVSPTTLSATLKQVEEVFAAYHLDIDRRPNHGLRVRGAEIDIRRLLIDRYISRDVLPPELGEFAHERLDTLIGTVKGLIARYGIRLSEFAFKSFVSYSYVAWNRVLSGFPLPHAAEEDMPAIEPAEREVARCLVEELDFASYTDHVADEERFLELYLAGKRIVGSVAENDANFVITEKSDRITLEILSLLSSDYNMDLVGNFDLRMSLNQHLAPMDIRLRYGIQMTNPLIDQIKENYPLAFQMATLAGGVLKRHYGCDVPEDELGYIALILQLAVEKWRVERKHSILIVCGEGKGSARLLRYRFEQKFRTALSEIYTCDLFELDGFDFDLVDYIFTTVPIAISVSKPIIEVGPFLEADDVTRVDTTLRLGSTRGIAARFIGPARFMGSAALSAGATASKDALIKALCDYIAAHEQVDETFYDLVLERERLVQMRLNNHVALPHPNGIASEQTFAYVVALTEPVVWNEDEAHLVVLVSMGRADEGDDRRTELNEALARFILDSAAVARLEAEPTYELFESLLEA